jgi:hypothetical protein
VLGSRGERGYAVSGEQSSVGPAETPPSTQVDEEGDVLVTQETFGPPPGPGYASGWWASPSARHAHGLPGSVLLGKPGVPVTSVVPAGPGGGGPDAAISDRRIAYATGDEAGGEAVSVLELHTGTLTRVLSFPPFPNTSGLLGIALSGTRLSWAEQDTEPVGGGGSIPGGGSFFTCRIEALGPPRLETMEIGSVPASPLVVTGVLGAQQSGLPCTDYEA